MSVKEALLKKTSQDDDGGRVLLNTCIIPQHEVERASIDIHVQCYSNYLCKPLQLIPPSTRTYTPYLLAVRHP